jgi:hypothetical protein
MTQEELEREREALARVGEVRGKLTKEDNDAWDDLWYELLVDVPKLDTL